MKPNLENIDRWLFEYTEGLLSPAQETELEQFLAIHPELELELEAWGASHFEASPITFEPKSLLLRKRSKTWMYAAAVLFLLIGFGKLIQYSSQNNHRSQQQSVAQPSFKHKVNPTNHSYPTIPSNPAHQFSQDLKIDPKNQPIQPNQINQLNYFNQLANSDLNNSISTIDFTQLSTTQVTLAASQTTSNDYVLPRRALTSLQVGGYRTDFHHEDLAHLEVKDKHSSNSSYRFLTKLDQVLEKEIGLSNNQSYDFLVPGKSALDAAIQSVGSTSQTRFQAMSSIRNFGQGATGAWNNQLNLDAYARAMRAGIGMQLNQESYASGAINEQQLGLIVSPKLALSRKISLEPALRLRMGQRQVDGQKLVQYSAFELNPYDVRSVGIDSSQAIGQHLWFKDLDAALAIQTPLFFISAQVSNLFKHFDYVYGNQSTTSQSHAYQQWNLMAGTQYASRNLKFRFSPYLMYQTSSYQHRFIAASQFNLRNWQVGLSYGSDQSACFALGYSGKHAALFVQSARQEFALQSTAVYCHQLSLRIYSEPSRKARRYITL
ncbi:MAG: hypothetical protein RLZZ301_1848 [Bacteroidota bacterium]|jgi:hypothetical protein